MNQKKFRMIGLIAVIAVLLLATAFAGCTTQHSSTSATAAASSSQNTTRTITDMSGATVTIPTTINRIADGWHAHNEVVLMLGDGKKIVATTTTIKGLEWFKKIDPSIETAPAAFTTSDVNTEVLLNTSPDIVFISTSTNATSAKLKQTGLPVVTLAFTTFDQLKQCFLLTGSILGDNELKKAQTYNSYLDSKLAMLNETTSTIPADQKVRVLHLSSLSPLQVDGNNTLIDTWIQTAGGVNAAGQDISGNMQPISSMESIQKWNPDVIIVGGTVKDRATIMNDTVWKQTKAVQNGRVYVNPKGAYLWDRYSAEEALQIQWAAKTLYPDKFQSLDINNETKSFYKTFFGYDLSDSDVDSIMNPTV
jgi:iron complex transport system substrate-binding protein